MTAHWQVIWRLLFLLAAFAVAPSIDFDEAVRQTGGKKESRFVCQQIPELQMAPRAAAAASLVLINFEADTEVTLFRCVAES